MKCGNPREKLASPLSLPMRGAWIEIYPFGFNLKRFSRRSPCGGAWIEMNIAGCPGLTAWSLPMRERGLKFQRSSITDRERRSLPMRGAWIEIYPFGFNLKRFSRRSPCGGAWIEMNIAGCPGLTAWSLPMRERGLKFQRSSITDRERRSLPMRGAWIEILPHR